MKLSTWRSKRHAPMPCSAVYTGASPPAMAPRSRQYGSAPASAITRYCSGQPAMAAPLTASQA
eukprot:gene20073-24074_t